MATETNQIARAIRNEVERIGPGAKAELARRMGVQPGHVTKLVNGRAHMGTVAKAFDALGIRVVSPDHPRFHISDRPTVAQRAAGVARKN